MLSRACGRGITHDFNNRAKEPASDAPNPAAATAAVEAAAAAAAPVLVDAAAATASASTPSPSLPKRPRDDEAAAGGVAVVRQKQGEASVWDWVRVHRVGSAGKCVLCHV